MKNKFTILNRAISLIFILSIHSFVSSQTCDDLNLVKNGNFEDKVADGNSCGTFLCNWPFPSCHCCGSNHANSENLVIGTFPISDWVNDWNSMQNHFGTTDYYNACAYAPDSYEGQPANSADVPYNANGTQYAHSGNAYGGIIARYPLPLTSCNNSTLYTEYLQVPLKSALIGGVTYEAKMYVSLADNNKYACAGLGMLFTNGAVDGGGGCAIVSNYTPQVINTTVITDMQNWVEISGQFVAQGGENYLTIGVFDANISMAVLVNPSGNFNHAYYYIDDVVLMQPGQNSCCPDHRLFQNTNQLPSYTIMNNYIKAGSNIDPNFYQGPVVVQNGQNITFQAGNQIILEPGFSTQPGAVFNAVIAPCENIDLCPVSIFAYVPNGWVGCPLVDKFCIPTMGADQWRFQVYAGWGNVNDPDSYYDKGYDNSGTIDGYYTCVWDGNINGGVPNTAVFVYFLILTGPCVDEYKTYGNISLFNSCRMMNTSSNSDTINNYRYDIPLYISPNPSNGKFVLQVKETNLTPPSQLSIYNSFGQLIYQSTIQQLNNSTIDLSSHPRGIYFIKVMSGDPAQNGAGKIYTEKIILQ